MARLPRFCSPSSSLHLLLLLCTSLCSSRRTISRAAADGQSSLVAFWAKELPNAAMPKFLTELVSPVSEAEALAYLQLLSTDPKQKASFCEEAKIHCSQQKATGASTTSQPRVCVDPFFYEYGIIPCERGELEAIEAKSKAMFFTPQQLLQLAQVKVPDTSYDLGGLRFLPSAMADHLELSLQQGKDADVAAFFGSADAVDLSYAADVCRVRSSWRESSSCHLSGQSLIRFVKNSLNIHDVAVYSASASPVRSVLTVAEIATPGAGRVVACHVMPFPSVLYRCHVAPEARLLSVKFEEVEGDQLAVCHMDTSYWAAEHPAFKVLGTKPGMSAICHWVPAHTLVFS